MLWDIYIHIYICIYTHIHLHYDPEAQDGQAPGSFTCQSAASTSKTSPVFWVPASSAEPSVEIARFPLKGSFKGDIDIRGYMIRAI